MATYTPIEKFFKNRELTTYKRGAAIVDGLENSDELVYFIKSGFVKVYALNRRGQKYVHIIYGPGDVFPLAWAINSVSRSVHYKSISQSEIHTIKRKELIENTKKDPKLSFAMLQQAVNQFAVYADRVHNLEYTYASERIAYRILFLGERFGEKLPNGNIELGLPISHQIIADSINLSREVVTREINKLAEKGMIAYHGKNIVIIDQEALAKQFNTSINFETKINAQDS